MGRIEYHHSQSYGDMGKLPKLTIEEKILLVLVDNLKYRDEFEVSPGTYQVLFDGNETYASYISGEIIATGFADHELAITLLNRTTGIVKGTVIGLEAVAMVNANVTLMDASNSTIMSVLTNGTGHFEFGEVAYGEGYTLFVEPPQDKLADEATYLSGYLTKTVGPFDLDGYFIDLSIELEYVKYTPPGYFNVTSAYPTGSDVPVNQVITVIFSDPVDISTFEISIVPSVTGISIDWMDSNTTVVISHDGFGMNTTYLVVISGDVLSEGGFRLWGGEYTWDFTTGDEEISWYLATKSLIVDADRTVSVTVTGGPDQVVYMVIASVDSFLLTEGPAGTYKATISGDLLEWETTYNYHFSDTDGGQDMAPLVSGQFTTPSGPEWGLTSATVKLDKNGNWVVEARGPEGQDVWIVIEGLKSYKLAEVESGVYKVTIPESEFDPGEEYDYHFSDTVGGPDKASSLSGSMQSKDEKVENDMDNWWICCVVPIGILLLVLIVIVLLLLTRKGRSKELVEE